MLLYRIQLPDLRYLDCTVDFSVKTFNASVEMCGDLQLRHPEELSLCKPLDAEHLRQNYQVCIQFIECGAPCQVATLCIHPQPAPHSLVASFIA